MLTVNEYADPEFWTPDQTPPPAALGLAMPAVPRSAPSQDRRPRVRLVAPQARSPEGGRRAMPKPELEFFPVSNTPWRQVQGSK